MSDLSGMNAALQRSQSGSAGTQAAGQNQQQASGAAYLQSLLAMQPGMQALGTMNTALQQTAGAVPQMGAIGAQFSNANRQLNQSSGGMPSTSQDVQGQALNERMIQALTDVQFKGQQQAIAGGAEVARSSAGLAAATPEMMASATGGDFAPGVQQAIQQMLAGQSLGGAQPEQQTFNPEQQAAIDWYNTNHPGQLEGMEMTPENLAIIQGTFQQNNPGTTQPDFGGGGIPIGGGTPIPGQSINKAPLPAFGGGTPIPGYNA